MGNSPAPREYRLLARLQVPELQSGLVTSAHRQGRFCLVLQAHFVAPGQIPPDFVDKVEIDDG